MEPHLPGGDGGRGLELAYQTVRLKVMIKGLTFAYTHQRTQNVADSHLPIHCSSFEDESY
jgi:hypothetical protein